jgi:ssDNA-binding Zn-finger/Zn-ribbon topoisomerase 1
VVRLKIQRGIFKENSSVEKLIFEDCPKCGKKDLRYPKRYFSVGCPDCSTSLPGCKLHDSLFQRKDYYILE